MKMPDINYQEKIKKCKSMDDVVGNILLYLAIIENKSNLRLKISYLYILYFKIIYHILLMVGRWVGILILPTILSFK
ncbi:hypothetical protein [Clostridium sp. BL-8]|uniref:hypothetical protein n=1 Tax=Clostridium sp. BL-8 TaxID=349938 RepID=UPI00098C45C3|nr:hypothetical protein [Clostridium sp. BL-8]OOM76627.1 hypothetical protein CLOBL_34310 [Clostridium sp. BL-8]